MPLSTAKPALNGGVFNCFNINVTHCHYCGMGPPVNLVGKEGRPDLRHSVPDCIVEAVTTEVGVEKDCVWVSQDSLK